MVEDLYSQIISYHNLYIAYLRARRGRTKKDYVIEFEKNLEENLKNLRNELMFHTYSPKPLKTFVIKDPKTRIISKSDFRDRIVHHALCIIIEPLFEKFFIYDSFANRIGKGTLKAIVRYEVFKRKITNNGSRHAFVLKADIRKYFENVNHNILVQILRKKIKDERVIWLIKIILSNFNSNSDGVGDTNRRFADLSLYSRKGMPLGNLTSQFWANVYLNQLDYFVKHILKAKYYIRYVDDFVILEERKDVLVEYKNAINTFLEKELEIELHKDKTKIIPINRGITFLGFRIFEFHRLLTNKNMRKFESKFDLVSMQYLSGLIDYDIIYNFIEGWCAYVSKANTYKLRQNVVKDLEAFNSVSTKELNIIQKFTKNPMKKVRIEQ